MIDEERIKLMLDSHKEKIEKNEEHISKLEEKIVEQIQDATKTRGELKSLCKSVEGLTNTMKYLCTTLVGFLVVFFGFMIQNHFVIH